MCGGCQCSSRPRARNVGAQLGVAAAVADVPLPRRDDLERAVAPLVELHRVRDRLRLADELAGLARAARRCAPAPASRSCPRAPRSARRRRARPSPHSGGSASEPAVAPHHGARRQLQLAPPHDVGGVAERADHRDAGPLLGIGERVRDAPAPARRTAACVTVVPKRSAVALVVGMRDERDARGEQLGPRRLDDDVGRAVGAVEARARGTRPAARGLRARPARPRCGSRRPRASAPPPGTPRPARGCAGTRAATPAARRSPIVV